MIQLHPCYVKGNLDSIPETGCMPISGFSYPESPSHFGLEQGVIQAYDPPLFQVSTVYCGMTPGGGFR
jgi:hypothetical protein